MSSQHVKNAINDYLEANWTATPIVDSENQYADLPVNLQPWITAVYLEADERKISIGAPGNNCYRETGGIQFVVFVASGTGTDVALQYAETIRTMIRDAGAAGINGVRFWELDPPDTAIPSEVRSSEGNYFGYAVFGSYEYDFYA